MVGNPESSPQNFGSPHLLCYAVTQLRSYTYCIVCSITPNNFLLPTFVSIRTALRFLLGLIKGDMIGRR